MADRMMRNGAEIKLPPGGADGELAMPAAPIGIDSPGKLLEWIETIPRRRGTSEVAAEPDGNLPRTHREIVVNRPFLSGDSDERNAAWRSAVETMAWEIFAELAKRPGAIIWRVPVEFGVSIRPVFLRHGPAGPDRDPMLDKHGWADHRYGAVDLYARLSVHDAP